MLKQQQQIGGVGFTELYQGKQKEAFDFFMQNIVSFQILTDNSISALTLIAELSPDVESPYICLNPASPKFMTSIRKILLKIMPSHDTGDIRIMSPPNTVKRGETNAEDKNKNRIEINSVQQIKREFDVQVNLYRESVLDFELPLTPICPAILHLENQISNPAEFIRYFDGNVSARGLRHYLTGELVDDYEIIKSFLEVKIPTSIDRKETQYGGIGTSNNAGSPPTKKGRFSPHTPSPPSTFSTPSLSPSTASSIPSTFSTPSLSPSTTFIPSTPSTVLTPSSNPSTASSIPSTFSTPSLSPSTNYIPSTPSTVLTPSSNPRTPSTPSTVLTPSEDLLQRLPGFHPYTGFDWLVSSLQNPSARQQIPAEPPAAAEITRNYSILAMEYLEGYTTLYSFLNNINTKYASNNLQRRDILNQVNLLLSFEVRRLHRLGYYHNDLHTGNIMINENALFATTDSADINNKGKILIIDFGRVLEKTHHKTPQQCKVNLNSDECINTEFAFKKYGLILKSIDECFELMAKMQAVGESRKMAICSRLGITNCSRRNLAQIVLDELAGSQLILSGGGGKTNSPPKTYPRLKTKSIFDPELLRQVFINSLRQTETTNDLYQYLLRYTGENSIKSKSSRKSSTMKKRRIHEMDSHPYHLLQRRIAVMSGGQHKKRKTRKLKKRC